MKEIKRDLLVLRRKILSKHLWFARFILAAFILLCIWGVFASARSIVNKTPLGEYARMANNFLFAPEGIVRTNEERVNILLLGLSGDGVKNPVLSDTMILLSIGTDTKNIQMISIPRDIWVPELDDKINSAYLHGNEKAEGGGLLLAKSSAEEVLGVPIQYAMAIDFDGFVEVIDILGGVEVNVDRAFTDAKFPIAGREEDDCGLVREEGEEEPEYLCRYETISFSAGSQMMNGETALKFARSRHSDDIEEGNDLARAARQQKVLLAIKDKTLSGDVISSPDKLSKLWNKFWEITETTLTREQMAYIGRLMYDARDKVSSHVIPVEFLFNPPYSDEYNNLYVFVPEGGNWSRVHDWVDGVLVGGI